MPLPERAEEYWIKIPTDSNAIYSDGSPLDAALAMVLQNNEERLCRESVRQLVWDAPNKEFNRTSGKDLFENVVEDGGMSAANIAALPADEKYKGLSWINFTLSWDFFLIADRTDDTGSDVCRKIRGKFEYDNPSSLTSYVHFAITTHSNPIALRQGDLVFYSRVDISGSGAQTAEFEASPFIRDGARTRVQSRPGSSNTGASLTALMPFRIWCSIECNNFGTSGSKLLTASAWETRS